MILGRFKKESLDQIQNMGFFDIINDYEMIPIEKFLNLLEHQSQNYTGLRKSMNLLYIIKESQKIIDLNSNLIQRVNLAIQSLVSVLTYNELINKRQILITEQKFHEIKKTSSDLAAKTDLLNKLNESIRNAKKKLNYTKEDYLYIKNQRDQIISIINTHKKQIEDLNRKKKDCFNQINKITRDLSTSQNNKKTDFNLDIDLNKTPSKAELIKKLQTQAKEIQYEINQLNTKIEEANFELEQITPKYETLDKDYNSLLSTIKNDEERAKTINNELNKIVFDKEELKEYDISEINSLRSKQEIEKEINEINTQIHDIKNNNAYLDGENPENLSEILKELNDINHSLNNNSKKILITYTNDEIIDCIESFRKLEALYNQIEDFINIFLIEINLETNFQIFTDKNYQNFFIHLNFLRPKKEYLKFEDLTTPEKIFFVISFYISIQIILDTQYIIFSNLFLPNEYNKRGSIFRTINKILPIFDKESTLKDFNLIFLISNLEMKKKIENIKIIKIEEN